jgi:asparagine synthase (glutamine-hydrolysing)
LPRAPVSWIDAESTLNRMLRSLRVRTMTMDQRNTFWGTTFDRHRKDHIYSKRLRKMFQEHDPEHLDSRGIPPSLSLDPVARILFRDFMRYLPDDLLVKVDVASMANSLEVRCPFLDHHLVELAMTIPVGLKIQGSRTKHILKKAFSDVLPNDILHREKAGFAIPLDDWLRNDLRLWSRDIVLDNDMAEFFNMGALDGMLKNHYSGRTNEGGRIWSLVNFSLWHKMFIRNQAS